MRLIAKHLSPVNRNEPQSDRVRDKPRGRRTVDQIDDYRIIVQPFELEKLFISFAAHRCRIHHDREASNGEFRQGHEGQTE